jgi:hypothetical protein
MMPPRLTNQLPGSSRTWDVVERIGDFLAALLGLIFAHANRRIFARIVMWKTGLHDPGMLPTARRRIAFSLCCVGTFCLTLALILMLGSRWEFLQGIAGAMGMYLFSALVLSHEFRPALPAFRIRERLGEIIRRAWQVITRDLP